MPTPQELKRQILERGVKSLLDEARVPQRIHLQVIRELTKRIQQHEADTKKAHAIRERHEQQMSVHEAHMLAHDRQIAEWDREKERLLSIERLEGKPGDPGAPGRNAAEVDTHAIVATVLSLIPPPEPGAPGKDAIVDGSLLAKTVVDYIKKEKLIDVSDLRNAQSFLFNSKRYKIEELMRGGGNSSSSTTNFAYNEVVSGSGTSWTLAQTPTTGTLQLFANGQRLTPTVDYSVSGKNITTVLSWDAGTLLADYQYA